MEAEDFGIYAWGQQSQQPVSHPPSSPDTATSSATQHSPALTATETHAIAQRRSILDIILPKTNGKYPKRLTMINRKWEHESTSGKARFMPKVFSVKRIENLNHQLPGKLEQFEFGDGTVGEFTSSHGISADRGSRMSDVGGKSLLSQILFETSNKRKGTVSSRKRRSIENGKSGSELPSGEEKEEELRTSGETSSGQEPLLPENPLLAHNLTAPETPENSFSGQEQESKQDPYGSESAGNESSLSESLMPEDDDASASQPSGETGSGTTLSGNDSYSSGSESSTDGPTGQTPSGQTDPTSTDPLAVNGSDVCNTCRGASEYKLYLF